MYTQITILRNFPPSCRITGEIGLNYRFMSLHDVLLFAIANYGIYAIDFSLDSR